MLKKMGEAVARVARKVNETVESGSDTLDLAECKLVSFPIGIYKVLRNVTDQIHLITLANNELKSLTSKFMTTFCQLRDAMGPHSQQAPAAVVVSPGRNHSHWWNFSADTVALALSTPRTVGPECLRYGPGPCACLFKLTAVILKWQQPRWRPRIRGYMCHLLRD
ncbi:leucine-rich repeat-containing protein 20 isoform X3 [Suricata suricatta]|uniref:leucine-rich repeat-containing protein 20 isoform X3 n=1 Tax=Suricata suricatta TaxID=37032 RepID=UPI001155B42C|nr:leucine-rich repeat-containing protein 20 isoform X3 [Suricata suricatta]